MKHSLLRAWFTALVLAVTASAFAQGGSGTTIITGTVIDSSGGVLPGATVVAKNNATAEVISATTNEQGSFTIPAVQAGTYTLTVTMMSFKTAVIKDVRVNAGVPSSVKVTMEVGGLNETVTVSGGSEIIQTQSAAVSTTVDANQILKLPTGSRSALSFVTSLPGVNTPDGGERNSTVNGLPQSAINITIDGISAQDNHLKTGDGFFARVSPRLDAMEEVTVSSAAQDAANTGQGAVQIRFVTRSGSNDFTGSSYFYLQHYKLNANSWFNNRNGVAKNEDVLYQPGGRLGGPIIIPGVWNGRNKGFFFANYEQSRSPGQNTENRTILHPLAEQGIFRYTAGGQTREVNLLALAASNGLVSTIDPTIAKLFADIRNAVGTAPVDLPDPLLQEFRYQYDTKGVTKYPTGRLDFNLTDRHRLSGSFNYTDLLSTPDTTNDREPRFPGFPGFGSQPSDRYVAQVNFRSTFSKNMVNEFKIGGSGGATRFSPEISPAQYGGTSVADQGGFQLSLDSGNLGISNVHTAPTYQAREGTTRILEDTVSYLKGTHNVQAGFAYTRAQAWVDNQTYVPTITFGIDSTDPAQAVFSSANIAALGGATPSTNQLNDARELYAVLTGRITQIAGELRLDEKTDQYKYLGRGTQRARLEDYGIFLADTWRWKPNLTWNLGLRYELQRPFRPLNNSYSKATIDDVCGRSGPATPGSCTLYQAGVQPGKVPEFHLFNKGEGAYKTDANNFAPSVGFAWTIGGYGNFLGGIFGRSEGDSVLRGGYTLGYNRPGTSDFTGNIDDNPGIAQTANRNATLGNLGAPGTILFRNRADLGPPSDLPTTRVYPLSDVVTGDILMFEPNLQVPYSQTWTAGWQRKLTKDFAVEARYVGTRSDQSWVEYDYNELNVIENGLLNEFRLAQQNLQANIAAGRTASFRYAGPDTGTVPLPIIYRYFTGRTDDTNVAQYTSSSLFTSSTFLNPLAKFNPAPLTFATALDADATRRQNALNGGLPANFLVANPDLLGGASVIGNGGGTRYHSAQFELRKRLSGGLQFNASYVFGRALVLDNNDSLRTPWKAVLDGGTEGGVTHAFKGSWTYELPFGQGRRWFSSAGHLLDQVIGGWSFDGIARIQSGRLFTLQGVRLVGMTEKELQKAFKIRFDDANQLVYSLPQDIVDNTVKAYSVSATTASGYGDLGAPEGRYLAPSMGPNCIAPTGTGDFNECAPDQITLTGPRLVRFDLSAVKRVTLRGRVNAEFRAEFLNAFNHPWFTPVLPTSSNPSNYRVTASSGGRVVQLVWRVNF